MPSKKKTAKAAHLLHPQAAQSDWESDTAHLTESTMATPAARTITELNLVVLRRYIPDVEHIISIAPFAVVYLFSPETQQWEKSGHEGTLFVCQLSADATGHPRYNVIMLNRKSLDNFVVDLKSGEDIEITEQYVILQVMGEEGTPSIYGLWIYSDMEDAYGTREIVANKIQECAVRAEGGRTQQQNGYSDAPSYGLDGGAEASVQSDITAAIPQTIGQTIDIQSLFNKLAPPEQHLQQQALMLNQPARFTASADTDFFRNSHGPVPPAQQQEAQPSQHNALLDLFKSVQKG